jgi:uncharacterized protein (DUF488 family)
MREHERNKVNSHGLAVRKKVIKEQIKRVSPTIFTIGHSNRTLQQFLDKLCDHSIEIVLDVRSRPASRWLPHFNRRSLEVALVGAGIQYIFRGHNLGGLEDNIDYDETITEVIELAKESSLALLCAEADYTKCHRFIILTPDLEKQGAVVKHIIWEKSSRKPAKTLQKGLFSE